MSKYPKGLDVTVDYRFLDAVFQRRSRRFGLGMEIERGPLKYKSKHKSVPLTELEEAILVWTELFYTNDEGTYMIKMHDKKPDDFRGLEGLSREERVDRILELFRESKIKIEDKRANLPDRPPGIASHNLWNVNKPGTTVFMPVTDLSACIINLYYFYMRPDHRFNFVDELHGMRPPGTAGWIKKGFIDEGKRMPLIEAELRFANGFIAEQAFMGQNMVLALQALGLGGWLFSGFASMFMLGGTPFFKGLGFRFISPKLKGETGNPNPVAVGKDGFFEAFCPTYYKDMGEAVEALNDLK